MNIHAASGYQELSRQWYERARLDMQKAEMLQPWLLTPDHVAVEQRIRFYHIRAAEFQDLARRHALRARRLAGIE